MMVWSNLNLDELVSEVRLEEFKSGLREFILSVFDVDVASDFSEFIDYDLSVFEHNFGVYLDKEEKEVAKEFFILMHHLYNNVISKVEAASILKSKVTSKFGDIYAKLKYQYNVI